MRNSTNSTLHVHRDQPAKISRGYSKGFLKILMLEDNENDAELIQMYLRSSSLNVETTLVSNKEDYIEKLSKEDYDVILSDHNLPQFSSLEALKIRNEIKFHVPFILVSGAIPEEYAVTILQAGANDYILKDRPQRLITAITEAIKKQKAISDKILTEQELRRLELDMMEQNLQHQKQKTEAAILAQEQEREYIGKELHDNINQLMAFAKMMIDTSRSSPEIRDMCIDKSYEGIKLAIEEVRKLSHSLVPPAFTEDNNFVNAVNEIVENIKLSGETEIIVNIPANGNLELSDAKIKLTFYRIIQEQLNNILKYSKASEASINLSASKNAFQLTVADNGIGFDCNKKTKGIGLRNIASRAELLSGTMEIITAPGEGCMLKIKIPYKLKKN